MPPGKLILYTSDSPKRPGNEPQFGDQNWTLTFPLSDGRKLYLNVGKVGHDALFSMMRQEELDDLNEGTSLTDG